MNDDKVFSRTRLQITWAIGTKILRHTVLTMELCTSLDVAASTQVHSGARREGRLMSSADVSRGGCCQPTLSRCPLS